MLIHKNGWTLLKAESDGVAIIGLQAFSVEKGWNILSGTSGLGKIIFLKAGMPPGNMSSGLGGSPIIPLSDQDELKPDENDIGSMFEPDMGRMRKDGDPFLFSEGLKEALNPGKG